MEPNRDIRCPLGELNCCLPDCSNGLSHGESLANLCGSKDAHAALILTLWGEFLRVR